MNLEQKTDEAFILSAQKGNRKEAFEFFYNKYHEQIFNYSFYLSMNKENAINNTQDTFVKLYFNFDKYNLNKKNKSTFKTWLYDIAKNNYIDLLRKQKKHKVINKGKDLINYEHLLTSSFTPEQELISKDLYEEIEKLINKIDSKHRIILRFLEEGYSYKEMSEKLKVPIGTIKSLVFRSRMILKENLKKSKMLLL